MSLPSSGVTLIRDGRRMVQDRRGVAAPTSVTAASNASAFAVDG
jgi:hypothetical protein